MNQEKVSILGTFVNLGLCISKLIFGFTIKSTALIADGVHSGLDIFSSLGTYLGIKAAKKPVDEKHPYGHYKMEVLAGLFVTIFLALSAFWILYEAVGKFFEKEKVPFSAFSIGAIILVIVTIVVNEAIARLKFHYGRKHESLSLVADAKHSRADVLSSIGVLLSLFLVKYFAPIDGIIAFLIGVYILFEAFRLGREITDSLLDVANKDVEERIKKICSSHKVEISEIKTRKIGAANFAEIKIRLPSDLKVEEVEKVTKLLEERLLRNIPELKYIVISIESHQIKKSAILSEFGRKRFFEERFETIGPKKLGKRIIIPLENNEISPRFGTRDYLVIDKKDKEILTKEIVKNPYLEELGEKPYYHGARFAKAVIADKVLTYQIGDNAKNNLESFNIEIEIIPQEKKLEEIIEEIRKENGQ